MVLLVSSAVAAPIAGADVICTGLGQVPIDLGPNGGCLPGIFSVEVASPPGAPPDFQESDNFQENFVFIVIAGPTTALSRPVRTGRLLEDLLVFLVLLASVQAFWVLVFPVGLEEVSPDS